MRQFSNDTSKSPSSGALKKLIDEDGLAGMTSNPAIFEKAIGGGNEYSAALQALKAKGLDAMTLYETLAIEDIRAAADLFKPVFEATKGLDGFVSLEVSPYIAHDTAKTVAEARRFFSPSVPLECTGSSTKLPLGRLQEPFFEIKV